MKISTLKNTPNVKNYVKVDKKNKNNRVNKFDTQKAERNLSDYPKSYRPYFGGFVEEAIRELFENYDSYLVWGAVLACYDVIKTGIEEKLAERQKIREHRDWQINAIANEYKISVEDAAKYHDNYMKIALIQPTNDGNEIGLNAVMGYGPEKYKMAVDFITPLVAMEKGIGKSEKIPNGILLYGPPGTGKTYMSDQACEHLEHFGVKVEKISLLDRDHEKNANTIREAFENGKERYKKTGKCTVINFKEDVDTIFRKRTSNPETLLELRTFLACAEDCSKYGVSWIGTANNPKDMDSAALRAGRTDIKMSIASMKDFAVADTIKYFLLKYKENSSAWSIDYQKIIDKTEEHSMLFTPKELNQIVLNVHNHKKPGTQITEDTIIEEMLLYNDESFPVMTEDEIEKLDSDKEYMENYKFDCEQPLKSDSKFLFSYDGNDLKIGADFDTLEMSERDKALCAFAFRYGELVDKGLINTAEPVIGFSKDKVLKSLALNILKNNAIEKFNSLKLCRLEYFGKDKSGNEMFWVSAPQTTVINGKKDEDDDISVYVKHFFGNAKKSVDTAKNN